MVESGNIDETILVEAESRFRAQDAPDGIVDALFGEASGLHGIFERGKGCAGNGRHEKHVNAGFDGAHGGFARRIERGDPAHLHGVGNDEAAKFHLVAQQAGEDIFGERGGKLRIGFESRDGEMAGHDRANARFDGGPKGRQRGGAEFGAAAGNGGESEMRIDGYVAMPGEMLRGGQGAIFFHAANKFGDGAETDANPRRRNEC